MIAGILLAAAVLAQAGSTTAETGFATVRQLYASAAYEDALKRLSALEGRHDPDEIDRYRALCLVGLGRVAEADQALERIVFRSPLYKIPDGTASPDFIARFTAMRKRVLPRAAGRMHARAKTSFDLKDYAAAASQLHELLTVLRSESASGDEALANLQQFAEGLLRLTEAEIAAANRRIYSALDQDVTPPAEIDRPLPPWSPPAQYRWRWFRGVVEVVVDERGDVETAQLVQSLADFYDAGLLEAARKWRFKPALRAGQPVKYRRLVEVTMRPQ